MEEEKECRIGVTGHRILADLDRVREGIDHALRLVEQAYPNRTFTLYSSLAEGADQLVAQAVLRRPGGRLVAVLPVPADEYAVSFLMVTGLTEYRRLLSLASEVIVLPPASDSDRAFENAGLQVLHLSDVVLAVWDGKTAQATGGTGDIVEACRAQGKPLVIVRAGNRKPGTHEPTPLGDVQGQVISERLPGEEGEPSSTKPPMKRAEPSEEDKMGTKEGIFNDDIRSDPKKIREKFGEAVCLAITDPRIREKFEEFESEANKYKKRHHRLGMSALVLLITCLIFSVFRLAWRGTLPGVLETAFLLLGMVPACIWLFLALTRFHGDWVLSRYKAERIRHWMFHQLLNGPYMEGLTENPDSFTRAWTEFLESLPNSLRNFIEDNRFETAFLPQGYVNSSVEESAQKAIYHLRLMIQINWFGQEERYTNRDRTSEGFARALLLVGAVLTFIEFFVHQFMHGSFQKYADILLPSLAISLLLLGAGVRVYRSASGISENAERYRSSRAQLLRIRERIDEASRELREMDRERVHVLRGHTEDHLRKRISSDMVEVERICHAEFIEFMRVAQKSDYLI